MAECHRQGGDAESVERRTSTLLVLVFSLNVADLLNPLNDNATQIN